MRPMLVALRRFTRSGAGLALIGAVLAVAVLGHLPQEPAASLAAEPGPTDQPGGGDGTDAAGLFAELSGALGPLFLSPLDDPTAGGWGTGLDLLADLAIPGPMARLLADALEAGDRSGLDEPSESDRAAGASSVTGDDAPDVEGGGREAADPSPRVVAHTIQAGDTLWDLAQAYGISVGTLLGVNDGLDPARLQVGQTIRILTVDGVLHRVEAGDTLVGLAGKYRVDVELIVSANSLTDRDHLEVGRELIIPGATPVIAHKVKVGGRVVTIYGRFLWPASGPVTSRFGPRWGEFHHGVDIGAPYGAPIRASRSGQVVFAGWRGGYGYTVILNHGDGVATLYGHASRLLVKQGQWVEAGQIIARVGSTGYSTGPHLHFEILVSGTAVDPYPILYRN